MKELFKTYKQLGFTLVEVMVSIGISSVVALVIAKVMDTGTKEYKRIEARSSINNVHQTIVTTLQHEASCSISLRDTMPANGVSAPAEGIEIGSIKRCNKIIFTDSDNNGSTEANCDTADTITLFETSKVYANNSIEIESMLYFDNEPSVGESGPRVEITYKIKGAIDSSSNSKTRVAGISKVKKESILLKINYNDSGVFGCETDVTNMINAAVEKSCHGNNAYLDKTGDKWSCYHELDLPVCPAGSAIVAAVGSSDIQNAASFEFWQLGELPSGTSGYENLFSTRENPSESGAVNRNAVTFKCIDISPVSSDCNDNNEDTLDLTVVTGNGDFTTNPKTFFASECVHVENCFFAPNGLNSPVGPRYLTYNQTDKTFKCAEKKCTGANELAITTQWGEKCVNCPAGSVIIKINTDPGFKCSNSGCDDSKLSGTDGSNAENVQKYFTGSWDEDGDPVCRDLVTRDNFCAQGGGRLKVSSDGSVGWECCPPCDASFNAEKANVCFGHSFTTSNGCTICEGTMNLQTGCEEPTLYCPGTDMGVSDCGQACAPGTRPVEEGTLSEWSDWGWCDNHWTGSGNGSAMSNTTTRTRTCDGSACGGNCNGAALEETKNCEIYNPNGGIALTFRQCVNAGGYVYYVDKELKGPCIGGMGHMAAYVNDENASCIPLCFMEPANNTLNGRAGGHPDSYNGNACSYNEVDTSFPTCPSGYTRYRRFSSAVSTNCSCCTVWDGCSGGNLGCDDVYTQSYQFEDKFQSQIDTVGYDKIISNTGSGNDCNTESTQHFVCYPRITRVGCYQ